MKILKNIFKNIKNFLKYSISPVIIIMSLTTQGIIIILYEMYCPDNYYYYPMFDDLLSSLIYFITAFFFCNMSYLYFYPLYHYEIYHFSNFSLSLYHIYIFWLAIYDRHVFTLRQFYDSFANRVFNRGFEITKYHKLLPDALLDITENYNLLLSLSPYGIIVENLIEINTYARIYLLVCFVMIILCIVYILHDSYKYYIDDKFIVKLRTYYPTLGDILMEGRNLIFDIEHFFLMYPRLCRILLMVIYILIIIYSSCDIDIGIYNNMEEYLYRSSLVENLIIDSMIFIMSDYIIL